MFYLEVLAGYNALKDKLLIKAFLPQNIEAMDMHTRETAMLDFRMFNPRLTFKENRKAKLDFAKKIMYSGIIIVGDLDGKMIYKREFIEHGEVKVSYYPYGFIQTDEEFNILYKFHKEYYIKIIRYKTARLFTYNMPYVTARDKFAKLYNTIPTAKNHINLVEDVSEGGEDQVMLTIKSPESKMYIKNCLAALSINFTDKKEGVLIWSR